MSIEGIPLIGLSAPAILSVVVMMILTGRLVPKSFYEAKENEVKEWREAYNLEKEANAQDRQAATELLEVSKTSQATIKALFSRIDELHTEQVKGKRGGNHVVEN